MIRFLTVTPHCVHSDFHAPCTTGRVHASALISGEWSGVVLFRRLCGVRALTSSLTTVLSSRLSFSTENIRVECIIPYSAAIESGNRCSEESDQGKIQLKVRGRRERTW